MLTNYSVGDNVTAVMLNGTGTAVLSEIELVDGFNNPLPITQDDVGNVFVGELGANEVTVLIPQPLVPAPPGSWQVLAAAPDAVLDAGGAGVASELYMVGGKTPSGHLSTVYSYDVGTNVWSQHPSLPGAAVETRLWCLRVDYCMSLVVPPRHFLVHRPPLTFITRKAQPGVPYLR